jgi:hypothetical protein
MAEKMGARTHRDTPNAPNVVQEPLHPFKFTRLSREIRDQIYMWALISPSPIIVWKGQWNTNWRDLIEPPYSSYTTFTDVVKHQETTWRRWVDSSTTRNSLRVAQRTCYFVTRRLEQKRLKSFTEKMCLSSLAITIGILLCPGYQRSMIETAATFLG